MLYIKLSNDYAKCYWSYVKSLFLNEEPGYNEIAYSRVRRSITILVLYSIFQEDELCTIARLGVGSFLATDRSPYISSGRRQVFQVKIIKVNSSFENIEKSFFHQYGTSVQFTELFGTRLWILFQAVILLLTNRLWETRYVVIYCT